MNIATGLRKQFDGYLNIIYECERTDGRTDGHRPTTGTAITAW